MLFPYEICLQPIHWNRGIGPSGAQMLLQHLFPCLVVCFPYLKYGCVFSSSKFSMSIYFNTKRWYSNTPWDGIEFWDQLIILSHMDMAWFKQKGTTGGCVFNCPQISSPKFPLGNPKNSIQRSLRACSHGFCWKTPALRAPTFSCRKRFPKLKGCPFSGIPCPFTAWTGWRAGAISIFLGCSFNKTTAWDKLPSGVIKHGNGKSPNEMEVFNVLIGKSTVNGGRVYRKPVFDAFFSQSTSTSQLQNVFPSKTSSTPHVSPYFLHISFPSD